MKIETVKYVGGCFLVIALIVLNVNMFYRMFFAKTRLNPDYKKPVAVTNDDIRRYADSLFVHRDSLRIVEDDILSNKRIIISHRDGFPENGDTLGFAFIVYEPIPCPSCSDVNYVLITDKKYIINHIIFLRNILENFKIVSNKEFTIFSNQFLNNNLINYDFSIIKSVLKPRKYAFYFRKSFIDLNKEMRRLYEKHK